MDLAQVRSLIPYLVGGIRIHMCLPKTWQLLVLKYIRFLERFDMVSILM